VNFVDTLPMPMPSGLARPRPWQRWLFEMLRSGTIASLVMMPPGFVFQRLGWRVGHYGPKFAQLYAEQPGPALLFVQHLVIGWVSALPLLWLLWRGGFGQRPVAAGLLYGAGYYVLVNALALPLAFGDPLPWLLGWRTVLPSLVVHLVFGGCIGFTAGAYSRSSSR